jgi:CDP-diacylglycerol--glycerol-3-phosphate 3-phosphatidyltransferase
MMRLWRAIRAGYVRLTEPIIVWCVARRVSPNTLTVLGTLCCVITGVLFAAGWMRTAGWILGLTAFFDVIDGEVARRSGTSSTFGAFFDSTLDRVADGAMYGGLVVFFAAPGPHRSLPMLVVALVALVGAQVTSYTRAKADVLGVDLTGVGALERPERFVLLAAPQAFFGLAVGGWILRAVVILLAVSGSWTVIQRMRQVAQGAGRA